MRENCPSITTGQTYMKSFCGNPGSDRAVTP